MKKDSSNVWLKLPGGRVAPFLAAGVLPGQIAEGAEFTAREQRESFVSRTLIKGKPALRVRVVRVERRRVQTGQRQTQTVTRVIYHVELVAAGAGGQNQQGASNETERAKDSAA